MSTVETVRGPVELDDLGRTLMHEHVFIMQPEALQNWGHAFGPRYWDEQERIVDAVDKLTRVREAGIRTIVDPTAPGLGRYVPQDPRGGRGGGHQRHRGDRRVRVHRVAELPRVPEQGSDRRSVRPRDPRRHRRHRREGGVPEVRRRAARARRRHPADHRGDRDGGGADGRAGDGPYERRATDRAVGARRAHAPRRRPGSDRDRARRRQQRPRLHPDDREGRRVDRLRPVRDRPLQPARRPHPDADRAGARGARRPDPHVPRRGVLPRLLRRQSGLCQREARLPADLEPRSCRRCSRPASPRSRSTR